VIKLPTTLPEDFTVIDARGLIAGRLASVVAKRLLKGEKISIVNAEKAVLSGRKNSRLKEFKAYREVVGRGNPKYGPKHVRRPDRILRRMVRGMLPKETAKGKAAFKRLRVYIGLPKEAEGRKMHTVEEASAQRLRCGWVTLEKISRELGWK
jgi:large subunit ribosomal protein L13